MRVPVGAEVKAGGAELEEELVASFSLLFSLASSFP